MTLLKARCDSVDSRVWWARAQEPCDVPAQLMSFIQRSTFFLPFLISDFIFFFFFKFLFISKNHISIITGRKNVRPIAFFSF
jgi:hypothetical protein